MEPMTQAIYCEKEDDQGCDESQNGKTGDAKNNQVRRASVAILEVPLKTTTIPRIRNATDSRVRAVEESGKIKREEENAIDGAGC